MGVTSLWSILQPCARPTKLETLNRKRLAVDASIWIYQFLKAVRDKEGNALRNSHVVGFFRRICKLLFFGIKPVFVFDGGAPALKRSVIRERKRRREGRRDDAVRTAGKLLAVQMQRRAEEEERKRRDEWARPALGEEETVPDEGLVYVEELMERPEERQANRTKFRKKDAYHLPNLDVSVSEMGGPNDPRVMSLEELEVYARQFATGEDINVYDFSKIDYDSAFFTSLPASDRYNILNAARLRSRLRMGHSKEQLDSMFPDRMAFSKFQIERVTERNELTQRLMHINGPGDDAEFGVNGSGRVAGEKGREYVLVKNDGVEGGWALGVVDTEGRTAEKAIDLDEAAKPLKDEESGEDDEFEDVAIEGLNRLPKRQKLDNDPNAAIMQQRRALYQTRKSEARQKPESKVGQDSSSLFVNDEPAKEVDGEEGWEEVEGNDDLFREGSEIDQENDELQRAIAMSMEQEPHSHESGQSIVSNRHRSDSEDDAIRDIFQQSVVEEAKPVPKASGRALASVFNKRALELGMQSHEITSFGVPVPKPDASDDDDDALDLQAALAESRRGKRKVTPPGPRFNNVGAATPDRRTENGVASTTGGFEGVVREAGQKGPLPFEKLDLGSSLLGRKKMEQRKEEAAGGFVNSELAEKEAKKTEPLPPWFSGNLEDEMKKQEAIEREDRDKARRFKEQFRFEKVGDGQLRRGDTGEVIELDDVEEEGGERGEVIEIDAQEDGEEVHAPRSIHDEREDQPADEVAPDGETIEPPPDAPVESFEPRRAAERPQRVRKSKRPGLFQEIESEAEEPTMGDMADEIRARPPSPALKHQRKLSASRSPQPRPFRIDESEGEEDGKVARDADRLAEYVGRIQRDEHAEADEELDWSESEDERIAVAKPNQAGSAMPAGGSRSARSRSPSAEFEDVPQGPAPRRQTSPDHTSTLQEQAESLPHTSALVPQDSTAADNDDDDEFDDFSDPEDAEILRALAQEAEEHARFASTLNNKSTTQNILEYERELKQLRSQQKKDRRDADEVTHIMVTECQQLLRLFGLPYVTAPMEAEAQCAELVRLGLVDGIVTDDSDCFLFGGTRIYKNFFNQAKFVECYLASDLEKEVDLSRQKLIAVAHLLGSDYTEGLPGVGPVTALEILAEFPELQAFRNWWQGVQTNAIPKALDAANAFRKKFRRNATKLFLPPAFPDTRVDIAYLEPEVDSDPQPFQWGVPDLDALREFLMATIGWSQERTDEVLVPVIRDMNRRADEGTQANITQFFEGGLGVGARRLGGALGGGGGGQGGEAFAPRRRGEQGSKRLGSALGRMADRAKARRGEVVPDVETARFTHDDVVCGAEKTSGERRTANGECKDGKKRKAGDTTAPAAPTGSEEDADNLEARKTKRSRKGSGRPRRKKATAADGD